MNLTHVSDVKPRTVIQAQAQGVIKSSPNRLIEIHTKDLAMKKILPVLSTLLLTLSMGPAMADPGRWDNHVGTRARIQISIDNHHVHGRGARHSGFGYNHRYGGYNHGYRQHGHGWGRWHHHLLGQQLHTSICHRDCFATRGDRPRSGCLFLPNCPAILSKRANMQRALAVGELLNIKADGWFSRLGVVNGELCHPRSQPQHWLGCLDTPFA